MPKYKTHRTLFKHSHLMYERNLRKHILYVTYYIHTWAKECAYCISCQPGNWLKTTKVQISKATMSNYFDLNTNCGLDRTYTYEPFIVQISILQLHQKFTTVIFVELEEILYDVHFSEVAGMCFPARRLLW